MEGHGKERRGWERTGKERQDRTGLGDPTSAEIKERDQFRCARCGRGGDLDVHHRMPRSGGHNENASNRIALCRWCHKWAHSHPRDAMEAGFVVSRTADPASIPVNHAAWPAGPVLLEDKCAGIKIVTDE